jgi:uncharacterized protein YxjI
MEHDVSCNPLPVGDPAREQNFHSEELQMPTATFSLPHDSSPASSVDETATARDVLNRDVFVIKEHVGLLKASSNYDIYDPQSGEVILHCREPQIGLLTKLLRFTKYKRMTPFDVRITTPVGEPLLAVHRGVSLFLSHVRVNDEDGQPLGGFQQKLFSLGGAFVVVDAGNQPICELKGKWTGWDFRFVSGSEELARVSKKWTGIGKELFTSADTYVLEINPDVPPSSAVRMLIVAAVMTIDLVLKE